MSGNGRNNFSVKDGANFQFGQMGFHSISAMTSGSLVVGNKYILTDWKTGDDFTNVGAASNADGVTFTATGTAPTTWANSSIVGRVGSYYAIKAIGGNAVIHTGVSAMGDNLSSITILEGDIVYGDFTSITVTSGTVLAYKYGV